jgi:LDH2 family malate/lactate/ureidoglycolate dehydrogenase
MPVPTTAVPLALLDRFTRDAIDRMRVPPEDGTIMADVLLSGSLRSLPGQGQGVQQLPTYYQRIKSGIVNVAATFEVVSRSGSTALADAHDGLGSVMGTRAMRLALDIATDHGIGAVGVQHSTHFGIAAYYAMLAPPQNCIGLAFSNAGPEIAPWGGTRATVGTNPWAVAVPAGQGWPVVLDMANSTSGKGMIGWYLREGRAIPSDWALTAEGRRTEDPDAGMAGTLFPLGGPKGYAMAVIVDALTGVLTGSAFGLSCFADAKQDVGHLMLALDISRFMPVDAFKARMDALAHEIRSSPLAPGAEAICLPGELEYGREQERRANGVPIENGRLEGLRALAAQLGVPIDLPEPVPA